MNQPFDLALDFDDVLLVPQRSTIKSRNDVSLATQITPSIKLDFPLTSTNMDCVTGVDMALTMSRYGSISFYPRFQTIKDQVADIKSILKQKQRAIPSVGIKPTEHDRVKALVEIGIKTIFIDVAHAHLESCLDFIKQTKKEYKKLEIIVGVISTYQAAHDLFSLGVDAVHVGVAPGSICSTRVVTGHGMPQITAILEVSKAASKFGKYVIANGGMRNSGDVIKALAAGAHAVTVGNILAGTDEAPGKIITRQGCKYKAYNGSTSQVEKNKHAKNNPKDKKKNYTLHVEGIAGFVPYKGQISNILNQYAASIRSGFSYSNAHDIWQLHDNARFVRVTKNISSRNQNRQILLANEIT